MKLKTKLIALCDYATISQDNKLSLQGIFEFINVEKFPGGLARFYLAVTFQGQPNSTANIAITIEPDPTTKKPFKKDGSIKIGPNGKSNLLLEVNGLVFDKAGEYQILIKMANELIDSVNLDVIRKKRSHEQQSIN